MECTICQSCSTKYSVEEAKKMMIEGTVEVAGTVKVDSRESIDTYLAMANNAYDAGNKADAETYCNKIIEIDLLNYEAWFLKGKAAGWQSTLANKRFAESVNCFSKAIDNCPEDQSDAIKKEAADEIANLSEALIKLSCNNFIDYPSQSTATTILQSLIDTKIIAIDFITKCGGTPTEYESNVASIINSAVCNAWTNKIIPEFNGDDNRPNKYDWQKYKEQGFACISLLENSINISDTDSKDDIQRYKNLIDITTHLVNSFSWQYTFVNGTKIWDREMSLTDEAKEINIDKIMIYHEKIKEIDPEYIIPERLKPTIPKTGGCYIATAVYGSYDCPNVWTLRRYRDYYLAKTWYGRRFIHNYYTVSPMIVKYFGHTKWFRKFWQVKLDKKVLELQTKGVESTPYEDKNW